ncbi:MAG: hypothetical protein EOP53_19110 [Sphingobacteriales bacterium]|nr:MAG: hypothetical protein EOP53_19110 [Sphingobacteriales bacterium]
MRLAVIHINGLLKLVLSLLLVLCPALPKAQPPVKKYIFSKGDMQISLSKNISEKELDDFIKQYDVADLALKQMIKKNFADSIINNGWKVDVNDNNLLVISKKPGAADIVNDITGFIKGSINIDIGNPIPLNKQSYGINNFRKQLPFTIKDSIVTFTLNGRGNANQVMLAGNFTNWQQGAIPMVKNGNDWLLPVKLKPGKYTYKFIVDGEWINDPYNAIVEGDGEGNNNSVFYVSNYLFKLDGNSNAKRVFVAGNFAGWEDGKIKMNKTTTGWELPVLLDTGTYTYRFIVDGKWITDPANPNKLPNEFGEYNSSISVGKPVLFLLNGLTAANQVYLAGSFNDWRSFELKMKRTATGWEIPYVLGAGNYEYKFFADGRWIDAEGTISKEHEPGSVFVIGANYTFRLKKYAAAKSVFIAGDFNGWSPNAYAMKKEGDEWVMPLHLATGKHLYKFVVDGNWIIDPGNNLWEENEHGTGNSIVWVK